MSSPCKLCLLLNRNFDCMTEVQVLKTDDVVSSSIRSLIHGPKRERRGKIFLTCSMYGLWYLWK